MNVNMEKLFKIVVQIKRKWKKFNKYLKLPTLTLKLKNEK